MMRVRRIQQWCRPRKKARLENDKDAKNIKAQRSEKRSAKVEKLKKTLERKEEAARKAKLQLEKEAQRQSDESSTEEGKTVGELRAAARDAFVSQAAFDSSYPNLKERLEEKARSKKDKEKARRN